MIAEPLPATLSADVIAARVDAILAARPHKNPEAAMGSSWWIGGAIMFVLGVADGFAWWFLQFHTH
jgi:hypothetical protein